MQIRSRILDTAGELKWVKRAGSVLVLCAATGVALPAQTLTTLFSFDGTDGANPNAALVQATNGDLYGTALDGGANGAGTVFKITPGGTLTTLYNFCSQTNCTDGANPNGALVQATNGDFYGTTDLGGASAGEGHGTVFRMTPAGQLTTLYSFCTQGTCADGSQPFAGLVQATNGDLYGTTCCYGASGLVAGGTVFKITPGGSLTTLYNFCSQTNCTDGSSPQGALIQAINGDLYGTTSDGGANFQGTVFKITPGGELTTLYSFCSQANCTDGAEPNAGLVQAANGDFYGTTIAGGVSAGLGGTVFKITPGGGLTTLYSFCSQTNCTDGDSPMAGLVQGTNGDFYGTTYFYGGGGHGTVFEITPSGELTTLYNFCSDLGCPDGAGGSPMAGLVQDTNGNFYGTTDQGGFFEGTCYPNGCGTLFSLSVGLGPFVETQTTSGPVGAAVKILGSDLTGATSVSFNGTAATFTVESRYLITTTVPADATTGEVQVVTPGGTLSSNVAFRVP
jgi:uncharacterized repeat protein (TIGR03803 family)